LYEGALIENAQLKEDIESLNSIIKNLELKVEKNKFFEEITNIDIKLLKDEIEEIHNYLDLLPRSPKRSTRNAILLKDVNYTVVERLFMWFANNKN
jgi:fructose-specific phosphotransferase system component IIB